MMKLRIQETCLPQAGRVVAKGDQECCGCVATVHVLIRGNLPDKRSLDSALHGNMAGDQAEVRKIIYALPTLQSHIFYLTLYSLGLRLREATTLQVTDIISDRGLVHIHAGKGAMDRMVPLPKITLLTLRKYYKTHRNPQWIFPALGRNGGKDAQFAKTHVSDSGVQGVLQRTLKRLEFKKHIHPHVFRHAYATHLLEANIPIRHVQKILGHKTLQSTMIYLHVTPQAQTDSPVRVAKLMQGVLS